MSSVTLKDIAKALNISTSTVSRALRDSWDISPKTKKKVVDYANSLNYVPNPIALSLKENRSRSIGVVVPEIANNLFSQTINGIEEVAYKRGYQVVIFQSHDSTEREDSSVQHLYSRKMDGLLISLAGTASETGHLDKVLGQKFPMVYFDRVPEKEQAHKVVVDNYEGAFKATELLIKQGKKRIGFISTPPLLSITNERLAGYKGALEKYGLPQDETLIKYCNFSEEEAEEATNKLIKTQKPDAVFMGSDRLAMGCYKAYQKLDAGQIKDITLIGFTNLSVVSLFNPPISTICQPAFQMGQKAAELLLNLIESKRKETKFEKIVLETELQIRFAL